MAAATLTEGNLKSQTRKNTRKPRKGKTKCDFKTVATVLASGVFEGDPWEQHAPWDWIALTDPSSSRIPPVFTRDGRFVLVNILFLLAILTSNFSYFFSLVGSSVKIHSTSTGLVVSTLNAPPSNERCDSDILTTAVVNPHNPFQLITGTLHGRILVWDFINATLLQNIDIGQHIHLICAHEKLKGSLFVAASIPERGANGE